MTNSQLVERMAVEVSLRYRDLKRTGKPDYSAVLQEVVMKHGIPQSEWSMIRSQVASRQAQFRKVRQGRS